MAYLATTIINSIRTWCEPPEPYPHPTAQVQLLDKAHLYTAQQG